MERVALEPAFKRTCREKERIQTTKRKKRHSEGGGGNLKAQDHPGGKNKTWKKANTYFTLRDMATMCERVG